jgi:hypothetical protein
VRPEELPPRAGRRAEGAEARVRYDPARVLAWAKALGVEEIVPVTPEMTGGLATVAPLDEDRSLQYRQGAGTRTHPLAGEVLEDVARVHHALEAAYRSHVRKIMDA